MTITERHLDWYEYFTDTGCVAAPACLDCPLPICLEDIGHGRSAALRRFIVKSERLLPEEVMKRFNMTYRGALRLIRTAKLE